MAALPEPGPLLSQVGSRSKTHATSAGAEHQLRKHGETAGFDDSAFLPTMLCGRQDLRFLGAPHAVAAPGQDGSTASAISEPVDRWLHNPGTELELI
jgi:hypothetical protein